VIGAKSEMVAEYRIEPQRFSPLFGGDEGAHSRFAKMSLSRAPRRVIIRPGEHSSVLLSTESVLVYAIAPLFTRFA